jgi:transcriptional regulator with PAS, ATPase and Fis domain
MAMGRPKIIITKELLLQLYAKHGDWYTVADKLGVSHQTIYRRLAEYSVCRGYGGSWAQ